MKRGDLKKLRELTVEELEARAAETKEQVFTLRFQLRTGHLADFNRLGASKREYAQILTVLNERRREAARATV